MLPPLLQEVKEHDGGSAGVFMGKRWEMRRLLLNRLAARVPMVRARATEPLSRLPIVDLDRFRLLSKPLSKTVSHFDLARLEILLWRVNAIRMTFRSPTSRPRRKRN